MLRLSSNSNKTGTKFQFLPILTAKAFLLLKGKVYTYKL